MDLNTICLSDENVIQNLSEDVKRLRRERDALQEENQYFSMRIKDMEDQQNRSDLSELSAENSHLQRKNCCLEKEIMKQKKELVDLNEEIYILQEQINEYEKNFLVLLQTNTHMAEEIRIHSESCSKRM